MRKEIKWKTVLWDVLYIHILYAVLCIPLLAVIAALEFFVFDGLYYKQLANAASNTLPDTPVLYSSMFYIHIFGVFTWVFYNRLLLREDLTHVVIIAALTWLVSFSNLFLPEPDIKAIIVNFVIILAAGICAFLIYRNQTKNTESIKSVLSRFSLRKS